jgi:16S rRNA (cytosine967-C5)-methyltransferase
MTAPVPGLPARRAALQLLDAVLRRGQALENALAAATKGIEKPEDRALAHAIASETLRRIPDLDGLIDGATRQRLPDDAKARMVLRIALVQALVLGTPHHAAVSTALPLVDGGPRRLVHGVLGSLLRGGAKLRETPMLPPIVEARWAGAWGMAMVGAAAEALAAPPPIGLTFRDGRTPETVPAGTDVTALPGFAQGEWWVQNVAASLPARLLGRGGGRSVLDLCAAPGGKTMQLASQGWAVTAVERDGARLARLRQNLERTGLTAKLIEADVLRWTPEGRHDAILLDAPCTATGIFARHPDVLHRVRPKDIAQMAEVQAIMLARACGWLAPGGRLVYATCSLEPEEGEEIAERAPEAGLSLDPVAENELIEGVAPHPQGWVRVLPGQGRDGFFIARVHKA